MLCAEFWTCNAEAAKFYGIHHVRSESGGGIATARDTIREGGNSGFQLLGLVLLMGASRVILTGFDMQLTDRRTHWHGSHPAGLGNPEAHNMHRWRGWFGELASAARVPILNATRTTALRCFPATDLESALTET